MNFDDHLEKKLRRQPLRPIPETWRGEILAVARREQGRSRPDLVRLRLSSLKARLSTLLWPHPKAWAGLAAIWLLIFTLNFVGQEPASVHIAKNNSPPSAQLRELLRQQAQLLSELAGPRETFEAAPPAPRTPRPRSQRREEFVNV